MSKAKNIIIYTESQTCFTNQVRLLIAECGIPFKEMLTLTHLFSAIKEQNHIIIVIADSLDFVDLIIKNFSAHKECFNNIFMIYSSNNIATDLFKNFCYVSKLQKLKTFLHNKINSSRLNLKFLDGTLIHKLIRLELESLGVSKKYTGFKFIVDLCYYALALKQEDNYTNKMFELVASLNIVAPDIVERDIRHMLTSCWKKQPKFKNALLSIEWHSMEASTKNILNRLISYLNSAI